MQTQQQPINEDCFNTEEPIINDEPEKVIDPFVAQAIVDVGLIDSMNN